MKPIFIAVAAAACAAAYVQPAAAGAGDDMALCRAALAGHPEIGAGDHAIRLDRAKGGRLRTLVLDVTTEGGRRFKATCAIRGGRIASLDVE